MKRRWIENFWFRPTSPVDLGLARFLFYSLLLAHYPPKIEALSGWAKISHVFWQPIGIFRIVDLYTQSEQLLYWAGVVWLLSLAFSAIGFCTHISVKVSFFLGFFVLSYPYNFGKMHHDNHLALIVLGILAWSRCGDGFSVDRWIRSFRNGVTVTPTSSGEYHWPFKVIQLAMVLVYMSAGYQKLKYSGLEWAFSDNLKSVLLTWNHPAGAWFADSLGFLCPPLAAATLFGELLAPLALFSTRAALIIVPDLFFFHVGAILLIGDPAKFLPWMYCFVFWLPINRLRKLFVGRTI